MKRFYKAMALVSLFGLGISNLFCEESAGAQAGYDAEAIRKAQVRRLDGAQIGYEAEAIREAQARQEDQLFTAVKRGDYKKVEELILNSENKDVLVNAKDNNGWTPLHAAVNKGHVKVVKVLIKAGANKEDYRFTPLHFAAYWGHTEIAKVLIDTGANTNAREYDEGRTPLHFAASEGHTEVVKVLLAAGANVNARDNDKGRTALHEAASEGHTEIIKVLLAAGADKEAKDRGGKAPRDLACPWYNAYTPA
jgi:ankyrin repeat protein